MADYTNYRARSVPCTTVQTWTVVLHEPLAGSPASQDAYSCYVGKSRYLPPGGYKILRIIYQHHYTITTPHEVGTEHISNLHEVGTEEIFDLRKHLIQPWERLGRSIITRPRCSTDYNILITGLHIPSCENGLSGSLSLNLHVVRTTFTLQLVSYFP